MQDYLYFEIALLLDLVITYNFCYVPREMVHTSPLLNLIMTLITNLSLSGKWHKYMYIVL
jgi:hypothetical protein